MNVNRTDIEIWAAFKRGDRQAFDDLFRRFYPVLTLYGARICQDREVLEDLVHDLFIELWQSRAQPAILSVQAYLLKALKYKFYKHFRKTVPTAESALLDDGIGFVLGHDQQMAAKESLAEVNRSITNAVNNLPNRQKEIIYLRIYQGLNYEEISEVMNINYQVARNLFSQSVKSLRGMLGKIGFLMLQCYIFSS